MTSSTGKKPASPKNARVYRPTTQKKREQALQNKRKKIMNAALTLFAKNGVNGTTVEQIAARAKVSKSNLLYYFNSKEQLYLDVIKQLLEVWLKPLQGFHEEQDALETLQQYIKIKLELSRDHPAESKLFCMEVVQGAPVLLQELESPLSQLIDAKVQVIKSWIAQGKIAPVDPYHLIISIWAITQHYADFGVQVNAVTGKDLSDPDFFASTLDSVTNILLGGLKP